MTVRLDPEQLRAAGFVEKYIDGHPLPYWEFDTTEDIFVTLEPLTFGRWALGIYRGRTLIGDAKVEIPSR